MQKKRGIMALKLDMSKAYDRMEWDYIACTLINMAFLAIWIDRVMRCVTTVTYSFLINGEASDVLVPKRGLRQGDPLSPYLFLICAEGLGDLLKRAHDENLIHGVSIARNAPVISHLFFADDSIVFARANDREAAVIMNILKEYESLLDQKVNLDKCEVSYSKCLSSEVRRRVSAVLGFKEVLSHDKYLGLPTLFKRSKKISFTPSRTGYGKSFKGGKRSCCQNRGRRSSSKQWLSPSLPML